MKTSNSAPKGKEKTDKSGDFAKGGSTKMFAKSGVAPSQEGVSAPVSPQSFNKDAPKGGKTGQVGNQKGAAVAQPGGLTMGGTGGDNTFKVSGGKTKMFGFTGAQPARAK